MYIGDSWFHGNPRNKPLYLEAHQKPNTGHYSAICEIQWLTYLLEEFKTDFQKPTTLYCDNKCALHIVSNPVFHERTKYIEIDCHIVREKVLRGRVKLLLIPSHSFYKSIS